MNRGRDGAVDSGSRLLWGLMAIAALAAIVVLAGEQALAKRMVGTGGADRIVGTAKGDRINARGGNDRVNGRGGADRLKGAKGKDRLEGAKGRDRLRGGKGADRVKAVDGRKDRAVNGGAGKDLCVIDQADLSLLRNCEKTKVRNRRGGGPSPGPGPGPGPGLRVKDASGLTCGSSLPTCPFEINGDGAEALTGTVSGAGGVNNVAGAGVSTSGDDWTAAGVYGCSSNGFLAVTIGSESVRLPVTCTV